MSIQKKLLLSFTAIAASVVIVGLISLNKVISISHSYDEISHNDLPKILALQNLRYHGTKIVSLTSQLAQLAEGINKGLDLREEWTLDLKELHDDGISPLWLDMQRYSQMAMENSPEDIRSLDWIKATAQTLVDISNNVIAMHRSNATTTAFRESIQMMEDVKLNFHDAIEAALQQERDAMRASDRRVDATIAAAWQDLITAGILTFSLAITLGALIARSLAAPIKRLVTSASELGKGHLRTRAAESGRDEIGVLAREFNLMADHLAASTVSKEHVDNMLRSVPSALFVLTPSRFIERVNPAAISLAKYSEEELIGRHIDAFLPEPSFVESLMDMLGNGPYATGIETTFLNKTDNPIPVAVSASLLRENGQCIGLLFAMEDITQRKMAEDRLYHLANFDSLTKLPNRILLLDRLNQILTRIPWRNRLVAVLFCDLDSFKLINDTCGHNVGDGVLKTAAQRLSACIRSGDTVARYGGDEFVVILNDMANAGDAGSLAQKIIDAFAAPFEIDDQQFFVGISIGISLFPEDGQDGETLLKNADTAMYRVKEQGKNGYQLYSPIMNSRAQRRLNLERELHHALENGELIVYYQPQIDAPGGELVAMEALVRWQHPEKGLVPPGEFLPIAEESGLILPLGEQVIRQACGQCAAWLDAGLPVPRVAVNLSDKEFKRANLIPFFQGILHETRLPCSQLEVELTEDIFIQDFDHALDTMQQFRNMGIQLSIDDFGTGYSSFSQLKRFPINTLKIDRSFIVDICDNDDDATITAAIIAMARTLRLEIIAEGIETEAQKELLCRLGCRTMQGYLFSRPLSPDAMQEFLEQTAVVEQRRHSLL